MFQLNGEDIIGAEIDSLSVYRTASLAGDVTLGRIFEFCNAPDLIVSVSGWSTSNTSDRLDVCIGSMSLVSYSAIGRGAERAWRTMCRSISISTRRFTGWEMRETLFDSTDPAGVTYTQRVW